jgi:hypothetical protein
MQRHDMMKALTGLGLKGMAGAFDDAVTTDVLMADVARIAVAK